MVHLSSSKQIWGLHKALQRCVTNQCSFTGRHLLIKATNIVYSEVRRNFLSVCRSDSCLKLYSKMSEVNISYSS